MLREEINTKLKEALKAKESRRVSTLRLVLAAIKDREIKARGDGNQSVVSDDEILQLLETMVRQRDEAIVLYEKGNRPELASQEKEEKIIIQEFMPEQLADGDIESAVIEAISSINATSLKDMGSVMAKLRENYSGQMDFSKAGQLAKERLS
ncbi:MAG: glutamyl-tRNA amidotransferase [Rhodospirillaceae bacterium]|nr:glutamyl-tRNA amidotransferase [Rhodospirillaceae bacterium]|tara:strand:- start:1914 stop:2369 length:456 start_codon:yes stop_codon:yes gene_type:complete